MKIRYRITAAFVMLTVTVLVAVCLLIYFSTSAQQEKDFDKRLYNRSFTVGSLLSRLPANGYEILSRIDSATMNLLVNENILVYRQDHTQLYRFDKLITDTIQVNAELIEEASLSGEANASFNGKRMVATRHPGIGGSIIVVTSARDENGRQNLQDLRRSLFFAFLAGSVLAFMTGWIFSRRLLKPLDRIADTVNSISANNIEERLPQTMVKDEWNKLSITFNDLLRRLQDSFEIQGRFISNASHELSTPLTVVINQIDVTLQQERSPREYLRVLHSVHAEVQHMAELTQQLLTLARTARGGAIKTEAVRVDELLMDIPSMMKDISSNYTVTVHFDELPDDESHSVIQGNRELLLSAFRNIAENGCKYSPDNTVKISLSFVSGRIVIIFSNQSKFITPAELETIFQPFQRGSNVTAEPGYGLGLSLTRRIILLHKGEIKAELAQQERMLITIILPSSL